MRVLEHVLAQSAYHREGCVHHQGGIQGLHDVLVGCAYLDGAHVVDASAYACPAEEACHEER